MTISRRSFLQRFGLTLASTLAFSLGTLSVSARSLPETAAIVDYPVTEAEMLATGDVLSAYFEERKKFWNDQGRDQPMRWTGEQDDPYFDKDDRIRGETYIDARIK